MHKFFLRTALSILIGVTSNLTANASPNDINDVNQNSMCLDGYETQTNRTDRYFLLTAVPCGDDAPARIAIKITVPRCDAEPNIQDRNIKAGQDYFRSLADHARQSFRRNKAGYAAYARYAIDEPFYSECATP